MREEYEKLNNFYCLETELTSRLKSQLIKKVDLKNEVEAKFAATLEQVNLKNEKETVANKLRELETVQVLHVVARYGG